QLAPTRSSPPEPVTWRARQNSALQEEKVRRRKFAVAAAGLTMAFALAACGGEGAGGDAGDDAAGEGDGGAAEPSEQTIGVAMPTQTSERWIADGEAVQSQLEEAGYTVDLQFANDDIPTQTQQIDQMITQGVD